MFLSPREQKNLLIIGHPDPLIVKSLSYRKGPLISIQTEHCILGFWASSSSIVSCPCPESCCLQTSNFSPSKYLTDDRTHVRTETSMTEGSHSPLAFSLCPLSFFLTTCFPCAMNLNYPVDHKASKSSSW